MTLPAKLIHKQNGFTLVEIAIVLLIVALLMGGLLPTLSSQIEQRRNSETSKQLDEIKDALIGFAIINGRLPCPASSTSNGLESFATSPVVGNASNGNCLNFYNGYVPAATLGLSGTTDSSGFLIDSWGQRIRYAVTSWNSSSPALNDVFTAANGMKTVGISTLSPDLLVCTTSTLIGASSCGAANYYLTATPGVPVVIFSTGKNSAQGSPGLDEAANLDGNRTFVSHIPTASGATNGPFDDFVTWIPQTVLINRMVAAGKLP
jgi:prepilin-type N-terminal cleavage/methylation domain-containing protein